MNRAMKAKKVSRTVDERGDARKRILAAAARLIATGGRDAATTRAVAEAARVQAPTIYRLFGDKEGLLDAVAEYGMEAYVSKKSVRAPHPDPLQELRDGWDFHVAFGLANPALFSIMNGARQRAPSPALEKGVEVLRRRIKNIALAGRLRVSEPRALALLQAAGVGTVLTLINTPEAERDPGLSELAREAVMAAICGEATKRVDAGPRGAASSLGASLDKLSMLSSGERHLLQELLGRIADGAHRR